MAVGCTALLGMLELTCFTWVDVLSLLILECTLGRCPNCLSVGLFDRGGSCGLEEKTSSYHELIPADKTLGTTDRKAKARTCQEPFFH